MIAERVIEFAKQVQLETGKDILTSISLVLTFVKEEGLEVLERDSFPWDKAKK